MTLNWRRQLVYVWASLACAAAISYGAAGQKAHQFDGPTMGAPGQRSVPEGLSPSDWSGIRSAHEDFRHAASPAGDGGGGYEMRNPAQRWDVRFDRRGFVVNPEGGTWSWGLDLVGCGIGDEERRVERPQLAGAEGRRVWYQWDESLTEWYINHDRGLEHGYTLACRPHGGEGPVRLTLAVRGNLCPMVTADQRAVEFVGSGGGSSVTYSGLTVFDADGAAVPAWFERAGDDVRLIVDDGAARYPLTIDPFAQQAYMKASNTRLGDDFGDAVAVCGDTVVVGAYREDSNATGVNGNQSDISAAIAGAAYVFVRSGTTWTQQAYLKASNTDALDHFGQSVAVSGDTVVIGASGEDSNATGVNGNQADNSAPWSGAAYVFVRSGTTWAQQAYLKASNSEMDDNFGSSVAVSGDTVVIGAWHEASNATGVNAPLSGMPATGTQADNSLILAGAVYVFARSGTTWSQQAYLKASNTGMRDAFGSSVAVSGDTVVVGAPGESSNATGVNGNQADNSLSEAGAAYVFVRSGTTWTQQAYLKASNTEAADYFGSVAVSGNTVVVGASGEDSSATGVNGDQADNSLFRAGAAYVFVRSGTTWTQQAYLKASNTGYEDVFAGPVAVSGDTVVIGASQEESNATGVNGNQADNSLTQAGAAYVFVRSGITWSQQAYLKASNTGGFDRFGWSVAVSGGTVVVGAPGESSNATGVNGDQTDNGALNAGAVYPFMCIDCPGACCGTDGICLSTVLSLCASSDWRGGQSCSPSPCPPAGACCNSLGACSTATEASCSSPSSWQGAGTVCAPNPCPQPPGACCDSQGACTLVLQAGCTSGSWQGAGTVCAPNPCPQPSGACCNGTVCVFATISTCAGVWQGAFSLCAPSPCSGACCQNNGACQTASTQATCTGMWMGAGTTCTPSPCAGACCTPAGSCSTTTRFSAPCTTGFVGWGTTCSTSPCFTACCTNSGVCTLANASLCASQGGTSLAYGLTCTPGRCAGACCSAASTACQVLPGQGACLPANWLGAGSTCTPNPCFGACCNASGSCTMTHQVACGTGHWLGSAVACGPACSGACCSSNGNCSMSTRPACENSGGEWRGSNSVCSPGACTGACCNFGNCAPAPSRSLCQQNGTGMWRGAGSVCSPSPCIGACCGPNGICGFAADANQCIASGGTWTGLGTACGPNPCPQPGACCLGSACAAVLSAQCPGPATFHGEGTSCIPSPCGGACCSTSGSCTLAPSVSACAAAGGSYQGNGVVCNASTCAVPTGACCTGAACAISTQAACGARFLGSGTLCAPSICCPADFNNSQVLSVQDIFDFLAAYFAGCTAPGAPPCFNTADFNESGVLSVQDIFDFLAAYFAGCP